MNIVLKSVGNYQIRVIKLLRDVTGLDLKEADNIVKRVNAGNYYFIKDIPDDEISIILEKFREIGATVEATEDSGKDIDTTTEDSDISKSADKILDKVANVLEKILGFHENLFNNHRIPAVILFVVEALMVILLLYNYWEILVGFIVVICLAMPFIYKKNYTEKDRGDIKDMLSKMVKWVIIICLVAVLWKPVTNLIKPGAVVRNSYFTNYSNEITIGDAFENVFTNCKWSKYTYNGNKYVRFTGQFKDDDGKTSTYQFNFLVLGDSATIDSIYIDGVDVSGMETVLLVGIYKRNGVSW